MKSIDDVRGLEIIDINTFFYNYEGLPPEVQRAALSSFLHEGDEFVKEILDSVDIFDNELERATHSLKTMSKFIGAIRIVSICELLEQKLRAGDDDVLNQALAYEWEVLKELLENEDFIFKHK